MNLLASIRSIASGRRSQVDDEMEDELRSHIQHRADDLARTGLPRPEAERRARVEFGGHQRFKEECREALSRHFLDTFLQDLLYGLRTLCKSPGFMAVAILTLSLGIGANTAIFSIVQGVVLAPLPFSHPDRLVLVWQNNLTSKHVVTVSYPDFLDWQRGADSFQQVAAVNFQSFDLTSPGTPEHLDGQEISSGFFGMLGVRLVLGREFSLEEDRHGETPVVIISNRLWKSRFALSPHVLGRSMILDGLDYTVVGVLPPRFRFWTDADVYTPLGQSDPLVLNDRTIHSILCIGRIKPDVSMSKTQAEMSTLQENLDHLYPAEDRGLGTDIVPLKQAIIGDVSGTLVLLFGAVGIVLLIACTNVANLLVARSAARAREFAIRLALGANRPRIVRQLVTESVLLSFMGGMLGLVVAKLGLKAVLSVVPESLPRSESIGVNVSVLLFAFGVSIAVGILFGLVPALKSSSVDVQGSLKEGGRSSTSVHHRTQSILVVIQMALTLILLVGAGLLFRTIRHLWNVNPGFDTRHVITFKVGLSPSDVKTPSAMRTAYQQLIERIRQIPGVQAADVTALVPLSQQDNSGAFWVGSQPTSSPEEAPRALYYETGPEYLQTMGLPLLRGRFFAPSDTTKSEPVVVIDSVLAHTYFSERDPVGQTITIAHWRAARVIGVVSHVSHWGFGDLSRYTQNQIYISFYQLPDEWVPVFYPDLSVTVRTPLDIPTLISAVKASVYGAGSNQTVYSIHTMEEFVSQSMSSQRFSMILLGTFAGLALLLASVGIYGVISYSTSQRVQEIGIRMALGAGRWDVFRMIVGRGLRLALVGVLIGAVASLILTRLLSSFSHLLYGVGASDPLTFLAVSLALSSVALLACYLPARRAMGTDPMKALRQE